MFAGIISADDSVRVVGLASKRLSCDDVREVGKDIERWQYSRQSEEQLCPRASALRQALHDGRGLHDQKTPRQRGFSS